MRAGDAARSSERRRRAILALIRRIPSGQVATYGQIAALAGLPGHAREVGRVLSALPQGSAVPWHRVVNAGGRVSPRGLLGDETHQRRRLEAEGIDFDGRGRVALDRYRWEPPEDRTPAVRGTP